MSTEKSNKQQPVSAGQHFLSFIIASRGEYSRWGEVDEYFIMTDNKNKNKRNRVPFFSCVTSFVLMRWALAMIFDDAMCASNSHAKIVRPPFTATMG